MLLGGIGLNSCKRKNLSEPRLQKINLYAKSDYPLLHDCESGVENSPRDVGLSVEANLGANGILRYKKPCAVHHFMKRTKPNLKPYNDIFIS